MKRLTVLAALCIVGMMLSGCNGDYEPGLSTVLIVPDAQDIGPVLTDALPGEMIGVVSIESESGSTILTEERINLSDGNAKMRLPAGRYYLTEFYLLDSKDEALYVAPIRGSEAENTFAPALPIRFDVNESQEPLELRISVVSAADHTPMHFGYTCFGAFWKWADYYVALLLDDDGHPHRPGSASLVLLEDGIQVHTQTLKPVISPVYYKGKQGSDYTLVISKSGYTTFTLTYTLDQLANLLHNKRLDVVLRPAFTFTADATMSQDFQFYFTSTSSNPFTIDWGDGTIETGGSTEHTYSEPGYYRANVTGELNSITDIYFYYGNGAISQLDITRLSALIDYRVGFTRSPEYVDFSGNPKLMYLDCSMSSMKALDISKNKYLKGLLIFGNEFTAANVNRLIDHLYRNAVSNSLTGGGLVYFKGYEDTMTPMGPPTEASLEKLRILRDRFGWYIDPNPD